MSRLAIPISGQILWSTGDVRLWADVPLLVKNRVGSYIRRVFRIDIGTEITTFPAHEANLFNLPIPVRASAGVTHLQTGLEIRSGVLRFQVAGMDSTEYVTPCLFLGDPATPPSVTRPAAIPRKLLQPLAILDSFRITIDKDPAGSLYGDLVLEKR